MARNALATPLFCMRKKLMKEKKYCVYCLINTLNGKRYVGMTSRRLKERFGCRGYGYRNKSQRIYDAIQTDGWENFSHEVLESNLTYQEANEKEQFYIAKYNTQDELYGYNISKGGVGGNNKPVTPVDMYTLDNIFVRSFDSASDAAKYIGMDRTSITECCLKHQKSTHGYRFTYHNEPLDIAWLNNNARSVLNAHNQPIRIVDNVENKEYTFRSITNCVNTLGFKKSGFVFAMNHNPHRYLERYSMERIDAYDRSCIT